MLDDHYLDNEALADRTDVWKTRLRSQPPNMRIIIAEEKNELVGFGCMFLNDHPDYGTLLDNLHVDFSLSGRGIGKVLMEMLAKEILQMKNRKDMYLWVLKNNVRAIGFYEKLKGIQKDGAIETKMGNRPVEKIRYYWPDVNILIGNK